VTLERHPAVVAEDLPRIYAFIARDDPAAAERVLEGVERTFEMLTRQPECGVPYRTRNPNLPRVRMLPVAGFDNDLVFYHVEAEVVRVLYVLHGARHLRRLFRREPRA
jgi:toxin ParE1/3/4